MHAALALLAAMAAGALPAAGQNVDYTRLKCDLARWLDAGIACAKANCTQDELDMAARNGMGPLIVRLAWHCSGTYSANDSTGGCNGARIRFAPEAADPDNAGLMEAMRQLDAFLAANGPYGRLSYADLYTLAASVAVENMGGAVVPWRAGRSDVRSGQTSPMHGRLPKADGDAAHVRSVFGRMGFADDETVALIGAHTLGCAHAANSGYDGCWVQAPRDVVFDNEFFKLLVNMKYVADTVPSTGKDQFALESDRSLIMLPADMALLQYGPYRKQAELYARDNDRFLADFSSAYSRLLERGAQLHGDYYAAPLAEICQGAAAGGGGSGHSTTVAA